MWLTTYDKSKRRNVRVGQVIKGIFYKFVKRKHILNLNNSIGIQNDVLEQLNRIGVNIIKCKVIHTGKVYQSNLQDWLKPNIWQKDWGSGLQSFMPIKKMKEIK